MIDKPDDGKVVQFSQPQDAEKFDSPVQPAPWDVMAESLAAESYRTAHGFGPVAASAPARDSSGEAAAGSAVWTPADPTGEHKARMAQIQRMLAPELKTGTEAVLAWAGISLYVQRVRSALGDVVAGAQVHGPSKGRHDERALVYGDQLTKLANLLNQAPKEHTEAMAWWKDREKQLLELAELPRIVDMVERQMGGSPVEAKDHTPVQKIEGMLLGLLGIVAQQKELLASAKEQLKRMDTALKQRVRG